MDKPFFLRFSIRLAKLNAVNRLFIGVGFGVLSFFLLEWMDVRPITRVMMSWDVFSLTMIIAMWIIFFNVPQEKIDILAQREDESRAVIFVIVVASLLVSLFGVAILLNGNDKYVTPSLHVPISLITVGLSWIMLHTIFTIHYAHLYYDDDDQVRGHCTEGIDFPGDQKADYLDFAYFSFVIGMTFQVSDATITSRKIRRLVLLHSFLSFLFNTVIVALTISILTSK